ncbi:MAG: 6-phosphogluconolactonase [Gammaproteobacteria bacterium]
MTQIRRWHVYPDFEALCERAARAIERVAAEAVARRGAFSIVLTGGSTPREVYRRLRHARADWVRWHIYIGDERCVAVDHAERNDAMARAAWLAHVPIPVQQIHMMPGELGPEEGARRYAATVAAVDRFDLVLLGLGEDGHVASLFPGNAARALPQDAVPVRDSPKPPPERISLSAARLSRTDAAFFLVAGAAKRQALVAWLGGKPIPAADITPANGVDVFVDRAAMPLQSGP